MGTLGVSESPQAKSCRFGGLEVQPMDPEVVKTQVDKTASSLTSLRLHFLIDEI